jgi:hypothetical protein
MYKRKIQNIFLMHLLCAGHCSEPWEGERQMNNECYKSFALQGIHGLEGREISILFNPNAACICILGLSVVGSKKALKARSRRQHLNTER